MVILDSKRGDIGSTAEQYAHEAFERYGADAVTVNPYLGRDSVEPFLKHGDKGVIILCRTSNPGAKDFQDLNVGPGKTLFQHVAETVAKEWNSANNCMLRGGRDVSGRARGHPQSESAICRSWCRASARRVATWRR